MKRNKKNKIWIIFMILLLAVLGGTAAFSCYQREVKAQESKEELTVGENQQLEEGVISSMIGNEMELEDGESYLIPVGTQIETKLGAVTTFSRLSPKDQIQMLTEGQNEEKVILKIWITG